MKAAVSFFVPYHAPPKTSAQQKGERIIKSKDKVTGKDRLFVTHFLKAPQKRDAKTLFWLFKSPRPKEPLAGPLRVEISVFFPYLTSDPKRVTESGMAVWIDTLPDIDNIMKPYLDALTRCGYWHDDGQVASYTTNKRRYSRPGIRVRVWQLPQLSDEDLPPPAPGSTIQPKLL